MPGPLLIDLYCLCWNDARMLPYFFRHFDALVDRYFIFDNGSTDGSLDLLANHGRVTTYHIDIPIDTFVEEETRLWDKIWKASRCEADWVILTELDDHIHHPDLIGYLERCRADGITCIRSTGYEMVHDRYPTESKRLVDLINKGVRSDARDRLCIFSPDAVRETHFAPGSHQDAPEGWVVWPKTPEVMLLHFQKFGLQYLLGRCDEMVQGIEGREFAKSRNDHQRWTPDHIATDFRDRVERASIVPGLGEPVHRQPGEFADDERRLLASGLFDADWYRRTYTDVRSFNLEPFTHFMHNGWREMRFPNAYFRTDWYLERYGHDIPADTNPLLFYLDAGESAGHVPSPDFDPAWYRRVNDLAAGQNALAHYLSNRRGGTVSPRPDFDVIAYLAQHPQVKVHGRDPYLDSGLRAQQGSFPFQEGLPSFDAVCDVLGVEDWSNPPAMIAWEDLLPLLRRMAHLLPFDEATYLAHNSDVAAAVAAGDLASGKQHYVMYGYFEGRDSGVPPPIAQPDPPVRLGAASTRWVARSQYSNPGDAEPIELLPALTIEMPMTAGEEWCDRWCEQRHLRDFAPFTVHFQPVRAWKISDACVSEGAVVWRGREMFVDASIYSQNFAGKQEAQILEAHRVIAESCATPVMSEFRDDTALVIHNEGGGTWGHFLIQNVPKILLYLQSNPRGKIVVPAQHKLGVDTPGQAQFLRLLGIPEEQLIAVDPGKTYAFKTLLIMDFMFDFRLSVIRPEALELLQGSARNFQTKPWPEKAPTPIMIAREPLYSGRRISNLSDLLPTIHEYGLKMEELGARSVEEQINAWRSGRLIVSTLGSDLSNMIFAARGAPVLALTPDWFGDDFFFRLASACGLPWYEIRCGRRTSEHEVEHRSDFEVDPAMLGLALARISANHGDRL
jgi:capsular polysaccharide biosynthesis protein